MELEREDVKRKPIISGKCMTKRTGERKSRIDLEQANLTTPVVRKE